MESTYTSIELKKIGSYQRVRVYPITSKYVSHKLTLTADRKLVDHGGYCSDAQEDMGKWEFNVTEELGINNYTVNALKYFTDETGNVDLETLKKLFDSDDIPCGMGSGYCDMDGSFRVISGKICKK